MIRLLTAAVLMMGLAPWAPACQAQEQIQPHGQGQTPDPARPQAQTPPHTQTQNQTQTAANDAALAQRADALAHVMRCLVCQNQSLAESNAPLAHDMRQIIRQQLAEGRSEEQVLSFFQDRYGDFVRYDPPFKPITWLLWLGPFALLLIGVYALLRTLHGRGAKPITPLSDEDRARAARYLESES